MWFYGKVIAIAITFVSVIPPFNVSLCLTLGRIFYTPLASVRYT